MKKAKIKTESLADGAKRRLEEWIATEELCPGQQLKEEEIAEWLGISRPPVREAFKMLESDGLIVRKPRCGVFVTTMTEKDVWEVYTLKAALYEMATDLAIKSVDENQIVKLHELVHKMEKCVSAASVKLLKFQGFHKEYHTVIMDMAGNNRLKQFANNLHNQIRRYSYKTFQNKKHLQDSVRYHRDIVNAIAEKKSDIACKLMKTHVLEGLHILMKINIPQKRGNLELPRWSDQPDEKSVEKLSS
ncbi:MAG: GntR family transcriptional regulator [Desulfobacterales bacterium]|nr:GntR family transcriptional regulator [Desulfobacterales bacterium]